MSTKNIFLTKGASIEDMTKAMPKSTVSSGFAVVNNHIEYVGNPKALKFVIPKMVAIVETLDGFEVVRTPKTYVDKNGSVKTTNITTFSFKDVKLAEILCENVNALFKAEYEEHKAKKENK